MLPLKASGEDLFLASLQPLVLLGLWPCDSSFYMAFSCVSVSFQISHFVRTLVVLDEELALLQYDFIFTNDICSYLIFKQDPILRYCHVSTSIHKFCRTQFNT